MTSLILTTATTFLHPLLLLLSVFLLLSGHDQPGGGFAGGLVAAAAYTLHSIGSGVEATRRALRFSPLTLIGVGVLVQLSSGLIGMFLGLPFLTSLWADTKLPVLGQVKLGTPMLFDTGVYLVVLGITLTIVLSLAEE
ncbi:MAG TPA: Na+/H+ antiporter subunit B [Myxococcaceae bacterium]|nr:Na+/H+ antiporter subunit B [Myxococcaceae bacterium]